MKMRKSVIFDHYLDLSLACAECLFEDNEEILLRLYGFPSVYPPGHSEYSSSFKDNLINGER